MNDYDPNFTSKKTFFLVGQKAIVLNSSNQILLLQRSEKSGAGGKWSLPGGGLESDEDPRSSIEREIKEETQLDVSNIEPFSTRSYAKDGDSIVIIGYKCSVNLVDVKLNWEHDDSKWVEKTDAQKMDLTDDARFFIEKYDR